MPFPILQLWPGKEVPAGHIQGFSGGNHERLWSRWELELELCEPWSSRPSSPHSPVWPGSIASHFNLLRASYHTNPASLSLSSFPTGQLYGLEKFWAFLKYSKAKNLDIDPKLQEYLGKFRRLEDFRVDVSTGLSLVLGCPGKNTGRRSGNLGSWSSCVVPLAQGYNPPSLGLVSSSVKSGWEVDNEG